jgi:hypothetical protein
MGAFNAAGDAARRRLQTRALQRTLDADQNLVPGYIQTSCESGAAEYIAEISYHRYRKPQPGTLRLFATSLRNNGPRQCGTHWADHRELAEDLTQANVSAWQQHALVGSHDGDNGGRLFVSDRASGSWRFGKRTFSQRYFIIRRSVRLDAKAPPAIIPAAFRRPDGASSHY